MLLITVYENIKRLNCAKELSKQRFCKTRLLFETERFPGSPLFRIFVAILKTLLRNSYSSKQQLRVNSLLRSACFMEDLVVQTNVALRFQQSSVST